jgi:hypothetical protein
MRRAVLMVTFVSCGGPLLLSLVVLALVWRGEINTLVLPDAAYVHIEQPSLSRQHITYRLPLAKTEDDLAALLVQDGWARDIRGQLGRFRDPNGAEAFMVFTRKNWFGLVPELVTVGRTTPDQHAVDIQLSRCFALGSWMRCL